MKTGKIIAGALSLCLLGGAFPTFSNYENFAVTANAAEIIDSGYCRDIDQTTGDTNITYTYDSDGVLTISGTGEMVDFKARDRTPWSEYRDDIKKLVIEEGVTSIGERSLGAFTNCKEISLPSTIKRIDEFFNYASLESITLPEGLEEIDVQTFVNCDLLKTVTIPSTVTSIGKGAFEWCDSLYEIKVASGNANYTDIDGVLYNKDMTKILQYPNGKSLISYTVPSTVTTIGEDAFSEAKNLVKIILPDSITTIEKLAFTGSGIKSMSIPSGVSVINRSTFNSCLSLESIVVPANVTQIDELAFRNCENLEKIVIENPLCEIADSRSTICSNLFLAESYSKYDGIIYGYAGSTAQTYAEKYGYNFDLIENYTVNYNLGDINDDGTVDARDASMALSEYALTATGSAPTFTDSQKLAANVNDDSAIDARDASIILSYYAYTATGGTDSLEAFLKK